MGNVHTIIQIKPYEIGEGVAIRVRDSYLATIRDKFEYLDNARSGFYTSFHPAGQELQIHNMFNDRNLGVVDGSHITILSGGKMWVEGGYEGFIKHIRKFAPYFEDALFYVMDEYEAFIDEFEIVSGELQYKRVAKGYEHFTLHLLDHVVSNGHMPIPDLSYQLDLSCWDGFAEFTLNLTDGLGEFEISWNTDMMLGENPDNHIQAMVHNLPAKYRFLLDVTSKHEQPTLTDFKKQVAFTNALINTLDELGCWATITKGFANEDFAWSTLPTDS